ncbi:uncharacterized protein LOC135487786 isoform X2 [Lineus longissimus]|uniref:uncharacterized protein LOC135487786 isoform X2 n=1 Tax=Lineus longissimus TaxID=88925 RepID=UPI002B4DDD01
MSLEEHNKIESLRKVFIGGLPAATKETDLTEYFSQFGEVHESAVVLDEAKKSRGFGFVTFCHLDGIHKCLDFQKESGKKHSLNGEDIDVRRSIPKELLQEMKDAQSGGDVKIYMKFSQSVAKEIDENAIMEFFEKMPLHQGKRPKSVEFILNKETKEKTGSAFVKFDDDDDVVKAATVKEFDWNGSKATCCIARPKRNRRFGGPMGGGFGGGYGGGRGGPRGGRGRGMRGGGGGYGRGGNRNYGGGWDSYGNGYDDGYGGYGGGYGGYGGGYDDGYGYGGGYSNGGGYGRYGDNSGGGPRPRWSGGGGRYQPY